MCTALFHIYNVVMRVNNSLCVRMKHPDERERERGEKYLSSYTLCFLLLLPLILTHSHSWYDVLSASVYVYAFCLQCGFTTTRISTFMT